MSGRAIGGFLPLDSDPLGASGGVLKFWGVTEANAWKFANARSALAHCLKVSGARRLVLPAYICSELASAAGDGIEVAFYPLSDTLSPNVIALAEIVEPGDCVVVVDYFGRPPAQEFRDFAAMRNEIEWVEDCAQALDPGTEPWADWMLYSPRKLFGVPDGGILKRVKGDVPPVHYSVRGEEDREIPRRLRRDDPDERDNEIWYEAYRAVEAAMAPTCEPISCYSTQRLGMIDVDAVVARRKANYAVLEETVSKYSFYDATDNGFVPFGFPVRIGQRDHVWRKLRERRVFCARYWARLPCDTTVFPYEYAISRTVLMLPCDHRYDPADMVRVASAFHEAIQ